MKYTRLAYVVLFAAATLASAAQWSTVPRVGQIFVAGTNLPLAAVSRKPSFAQVVDYPSGDPFAASLAVADVNGDGKLDLVVSHHCADYPGCTTKGTVGVLLGNGNGTFQAPRVFGSGGFFAGSIAVADVNGDGKPDVVVVNGCPGDTAPDCSGSGMVSVLLGNGDGTLQAAVSFGAGPLTRGLAVGDVNRDGNPDLIVGNECDGRANCPSGEVSVLLGNGDGTFQSAVNYLSGELTEWVELADVNGDGKLDLVVADFCDGLPNCPSGEVGVLLGNGDGTFQTVVSYPSGGSGAASVAVGDVNGDGKLDVVVGNVNNDNAGDGSVGVLLGNGDGTFKAAVAFQADGQIANSVILSDVNGDGRLDLLVPQFCPFHFGCRNSRVEVLVGAGDGTFQFVGRPVTGEDVFFAANAIALGDVNGDGKADVLVATSRCAGDPCVLETGTVGVLSNTSVVETHTALASSSNPAHVHQRVTFTATVTGLFAQKTTGSVTFMQGDFVLRTAPVVSGKATFAHTFTKTGTLPIKAVFSGDSNNKASTSATLSQVVTP
jgi:hypothetical protein